MSANYSEQVCRPQFILASGWWPPGPYIALTGYISSRVGLLLFANHDYSTQIYKETRLSGVGFNGYISSRVCLLLRHRSPRLSNPNLEKFSWKVCCRTGPSRPLSALHIRMSTLTKRPCPFPNPDDWKITPIWSYLSARRVVPHQCDHYWAIKYCDQFWARGLNLVTTTTCARIKPSCSRGSLIIWRYSAKRG